MPDRGFLALGDGTRGRAVMAALAGCPEGLTSRELADLGGEGHSQPTLTRYGGVLRLAGDYGWVARAGLREGSNAIIYRITDAGREALDKAVSWPRVASSGRVRRRHAGPALRLRREWLARLDGLYEAATEASGEDKAVLLGRAGELEACIDGLRAVIRAAMPLR